MLAEKGIAWESRIVDIINMENYEPWYVSISATAEVPAFVRGDLVIVQSEAIARHIDVNFPGPRLFPEESAASDEVERWVERAREFPMEALHAALAGSGQARMEGRLFGPRITALRAFAKRRPDLESRYRAKMEDIEQKSAIAASPMPREQAHALLDAELDALEAALAQYEWIAGDAYSMADVFWTVVLARLSMLGQASAFAEARRPSVARFWKQVKARPSFKEADIWVRMRPFVMAPYLLRLFKTLLTS